MNKNTNQFFFNEYLQEYHFDFDESLIAKFPVEPRDHSNLMIINNEDHIIEDKFYNILSYVPENVIFVFNNTKVSYRRVYVKRENQKIVEILFLENQNNVWKVLIRNGKKLKIGETFYLDTYSFVLEEKQDGFYYISCWEQKKPSLNNLEQSELFFTKYGYPPLPPYLKRKAEERDKFLYQSVFAKKSGSVAAPTASLHFTTDLYEKIQRKFNVVFINLQIGYATFAPLKEKNFIKNELHPELYEIPETTAEILNQNIFKHPILAVGTTTLRALEDNFRKFQKFVSGTYITKIFLKPPDSIHSVDYLITNFHLPASSLFLLVCAFSKKEIIKKAYQIAVEKRYRFFSYGDAMLLKNLSKN